MKIGSSDISKVYLGTDDVDKMYLGSTEVYSSGPIVLPYDAEVEYLQSDGNQWFTLPTTVSESTDAIEIDCRLTGTPEQTRFCYAEAEDSAYHLYINGHGVLAYSSNGNWTEPVNHNRFKVGLVRHKLKLDKKSKKISIDFLELNATGTSSRSGTALFMFKQYGTNPVFQGLIYSVKFWKNGTLKYDLIPVRKNSIGYFYDKVSGTLFSNEGTGNWTIGYDKKILLSDYIELDYIQNTETTATAPYIDTGISNDATTDAINMQMTIKWDSIDSAKNQQFGNTYLVTWGCKQGVWHNAFTMEDVDLESTSPSTSDYVTVKSKQFTGTPDYAGPIALFRQYNGGSRMNNSNTSVCLCKLSAYKIWVAGTLVRDFVPVLHPANVYGMFDLVENKFYGSANSGSFTGGNNS